ncbi:uncharacterized protein LOC126265388 [Aethina tumida]|uniref:uncharacterized protein LOC126265388 n=1 Tax=Aethina tumida TaxID=116153 RepID=UPI002148054D|nr:uncharacterized protein LOC126265388 [Aethina tumida]
MLTHLLLFMFTPSISFYLFRLIYSHPNTFNNIQSSSTTNQVHQIRQKQPTMEIELATSALEFLDVPDSTLQLEESFSDFVELVERVSSPLPSKKFKIHTGDVEYEEWLRRLDKGLAKFNARGMRKGHPDIICCNLLITKNETEDVPNIEPVNPKKKAKCFGNMKRRFENMFFKVVECEPFVKEPKCLEEHYHHLSSINEDHETKFAIKFSWITMWF